MRAVDVAVAILQREGVTNVFGLPGAAINPFYSALKASGSIRHTLARHVEGAAHMAEGATRARAGNIGVCVGTSRPAGTDMITGLYSAAADSIPILCITGQAPVSRLHKEDFQAVDIASIARPVTKLAMTVLEPTQIGRVFAPDLGIVSDAKAALEMFIDVAEERQLAGTLPGRGDWAIQCQQRKLTMHRKTHFNDVPIKPQRVFEEMNRAFGADVRYVTTIGLSQIAAAQFLHVYAPRNWINAGQAGPLGWTLPAALGVCVADPEATVVALSGDYDFQFMIEELAVGAQFNLPFIQVVESTMPTWL